MLVEAAYSIPSLGVPKSCRVICRTDTEEPTIAGHVPREAGYRDSVCILEVVNTLQAARVPDINFFIPTSTGQVGTIMVESQTGDLPPTTERVDVQLGICDPL